MNQSGTDGDVRQTGYQGNKMDRIALRVGIGLRGQMVSTFSVRNINKSYSKGGKVSGERK